jgi:mRNA interferase RelE/StbE
MMPYQLEWTDLSKSDYTALDGSQLVFVDKALDRIRTLGMGAGQPLHGDLAGCNKLKNKKMGLRVVFTGSPTKADTIRIVAIGARNDAQVYTVASNRVR